jgi:hypothetical protein
MIVRFLQAIIRFTYSFENLGMIATLKIIWYRILKENIDIKIHTKKFGEIFWNTKRDWVLLVDHANYSNSLAYTEPEKWTTICSEPSRKYAAKDLNVKVHS